MTIISPPSNGTLTHILQGAGLVFYTPDVKSQNSSYDNFTFRVNDGKIDSNIGIVFISIKKVSSPSSNLQPSSQNNNSTSTLPTANDQSVIDNINTPIDINLSGTDSNPNADLSATIVSNSIHGTLGQINQQTGVVTYVPNQDYTGPDSFTFTVNDGRSSSNEATVSITVR